MCRPSKIDVSTFGDRCVDLRRSMSTFGDRCVDLRRSMVDVSMCRPSKIDGRCEIRLLYLLKTLILYISCMRITPRVCTSVLSLYYWQAERTDPCLLNYRYTCEWLEIRYTYRAVRISRLSCGRISELQCCSVYEYNN